MYKQPCHIVHIITYSMYSTNKHFPKCFPHVAHSPGREQTLHLNDYPPPPPTPTEKSTMGNGWFEIPENLEFHHQEEGGEGQGLSLQGPRQQLKRQQQ